MEEKSGRLCGVLRQWLGAGALALSSMLDGVILAVSFGRTPAEGLAESVDMLRKCQSTILGAIINRSESPATAMTMRKFYPLG